LVCGPTWSASQNHLLLALYDALIGDQASSNYAGSEPEAQRALQNAVIQGILVPS
jgi:hypothetical protein